MSGLRQLTHMQPFRSCLVALAVVSSASALAQEASPAPLVVVPVEAPAEAPVAVATNPTSAPERDVHLDPGGRVHWGLSGGIGWHSPYGAFGLQLEGRIGPQLTNVLSAYLAIGAHVGVGVGLGVVGAGASASGTLIGHFTTAALLELCLFNHFFFAAGPAFGLGAMGLGGLGIAVGGGTITGVSAAGFKPGFDARVGWHFGSPNPRTHRRRGFNLGVDVLTLFHPNGTVTELETDFSGSSVSVQKTRTLVTVTPMLTLGFEMR